VKQSDLGEYEENTREKQRDANIQGKSQAPRQTKPYGWQTPSSPRKEAKREESRGLVKMLVSCLSMSINIISISPFLNMFSQKVVSHIDVFGSPMENWIMG
jgi:hypothetical protein